MLNASLSAQVNLNKLIGLTSNYNKAVFLDKCLFWWEISKYKLDDNKVWFTRTINEIAHEIKISERSVSRYLQEFESRGYIEKRCKLSASNKKGFSVKKRLYIRITTKLENILNISREADDKKIGDPCVNYTLARNGNINQDNLAQSIYKITNYNLLDNITVNSRNKLSTIDLFQDNKSDPYPLEKRMIASGISSSFINKIKGMLINLHRHHKLQFSNPKQILAEVVFSVTQNNQWKDITDLQHRLNIIAKLLLKKRWRTPKGYYKYSAPKELCNSPISFNNNLRFDLINKENTFHKNKIQELTNLINYEISYLSEQYSYNTKVPLSLLATFITPSARKLESHFYERNKQKDYLNKLNESSALLISKYNIYYTNCINNEINRFEELVIKSKKVLDSIEQIGPKEHFVEVLKNNCNFLKEQIFVRKHYIISQKGV